MNDRVGCREMELLCRHRAALDTRHSWKWLATLTAGETLRTAKPLLFTPSIRARWPWAQIQSKATAETDKERRRAGGSLGVHQSTP